MGNYKTGTVTTLPSLGSPKGLTQLLHVKFLHNRCGLYKVEHECLLSKDTRRAAKDQQGTGAPLLTHQ